jgi:hypothetical protein
MWELSFVGCNWRLVEGDEEGVGCVEAETPRLEEEMKTVEMGL